MKFFKNKKMVLSIWVLSIVSACTWTIPETRQKLGLVENAKSEAGTDAEDAKSDAEDAKSEAGTDAEDAKSEAGTNAEQDVCLKLYADASSSFAQQAAWGYITATIAVGLATAGTILAAQDDSDIASWLMGGSVVISPLPIYLLNLSGEASEARSSALQGLAINHEGQNFCIHARADWDKGKGEANSALLAYIIKNAPAAEPAEPAEPVAPAEPAEPAP